MGRDALWNLGTLPDHPCLAGMFALPSTWPSHAWHLTTSTPASVCMRACVAGWVGRGWVVKGEDLAYWGKRGVAAACELNSEFPAVPVIGGQLTSCSLPGCVSCGYWARLGVRWQLGLLSVWQRAALHRDRSMPTCPG